MPQEKAKKRQKNDYGNRGNRLHYSGRNSWSVADRAVYGVLDGRS